MASRVLRNKKTTPPVCRRHNSEPITVFSTKFERCMCVKCAMEQHDHLSDFMPISEGLELMKTTGKSMLNEITFLTDHVHNLKRSQLKTMERVRTSDKNIRGQIRTLRDTVNRHLDLIEQKLVWKLKQLVDKTEKVFLKDQHDIQTVESDLKRIKDNINVCLKSSSDTQVISSIINERRNFSQKKTILRSQQERIHNTCKTLEFRESSDVLNFIESAKEFGEVILREDDKALDETGELLDPGVQPVSYRSSIIPDNLPATSTPLSFTKFDSPRNNFHRKTRTNDNRRYGLHVSHPYHALNAKSYQEDPSETSQQGFEQDEAVDATGPYKTNGVREKPVVLGANHDTPCNLSGVAALTSGRIVVCDSKHKCIQLINRHSEVLDQLMFHHKPCDIATISGNSVVVSFVEKDFVSIYTTSDGTLRHKKDVSISGKGGSYNIAYCKNKLAVCRRGEIRIVSCDNGLLISTIPIQVHFPQIAMSDGGTRIYLSDFVDGNVVCMDEHGKKRWKYGEDKFEPCSIAVDLNQLYTADAKGQISVLSAYGILVRRIQCQGHLQSICVDPNTGTLLVTLDSSKDKIKSRTIKLVSV